MPLASWLFVKDSESVWIERLDQHTMVVAGPSDAREPHAFADEAALQAFQIELAEQLTAAGWLLWGPDRDRRETPDRRRVARRTGDRRRPPAGADD